MADPNLTQFCVLCLSGQHSREEHLASLRPLILDADGQPICPDWLRRARMTDEEFWEHVLRNLGGGTSEEEPDYDEPVMVSLDSRPCPVCGEEAQCGYDNEGRPMIHTIEAGSNYDE